MTGLFLYVVIGLVLIISVIKPVTGFWLSLALFFDPGGFFQGYFNSNLISVVNVTDAFFFIMLISYVLIRRSFTPVFDKYFRAILAYFIFIELYFIIVYGYLTPVLNGRDTFLMFLIKERKFFYGFCIFWLVFVFLQKGILIHYKITIYSGLIVISLFLTDRIFNLNFIPVFTSLRYKDEEMLRIGMVSYGLFQYVFPLSVIVLFIKRSSYFKIPMRKALYISGIMMVIVFILSLTRRTYIDIAFTILFSLWIISRMTAVRQAVFKLSLAIIFTIVLLLASFPSYIKYGYNVYQDTFMLLASGRDTRGNTDYRISGTGDLKLVKDYIKTAPWFGQGFSWMTWEEKIRRSIKGDKFASAWDAAQEIPIYYVLFSKGILGMMILTPVYVFLFYGWIRLFRIVKRNFNKMVVSEPILLIFSILVLLYFFQEVTIRAYSLYGNLGYPGFMVQAGILYGLHALFTIKYQKAMNNRTESDIYKNKETSADGNLKIRKK